MPVYLPPNFNTGCSIWKRPAVPAVNLPTFTGVLLQIYIYSRSPELLFHPGSGRYLPLIIIREPYSAANKLAVDDIVQHTSHPAAPDQFLRVQYALHMHVGFPNQYFAYPSLRCNANGTIPLTPLPT